MSRHVRERDGVRVTVGWDPPLQTYFGTVHRGDDLVLWVGADEVLPEIEDLARAMGRHRPVVDDLSSALYTDRDENRA